LPTLLKPWAILPVFLTFLTFGAPTNGDILVNNGEEEALPWDIP